MRNVKDQREIKEKQRRAKQNNEKQRKTQKNI